MKTNAWMGVGIGALPGFASQEVVRDGQETVRAGRLEVMEDEAHTLNGAAGENLLFFDGFTRIGPRKYKHPAEQWKLEHLLKDMDQCSISAALVAYTQSVNYDLMYSNLELNRLIKPYPHLFPVWNVMPHQTGEFPDPTGLGRLMAENNVRAVTIHPKTNAWDWKARHCTPLFAHLSKNKILTITTAPELGAWEDLEEFLIRYPTLPLLLTGAFWNEQRYVLPLVQQYKNLHISFDNFQINEGVEYLHRTGCTDQLIFASNSPTMSAGAHRSYIDYAAIPAADRAKIAGGNLMRLLKITQKPALRQNQNEDILMRAIRAGSPLPVSVIDMHMHMLHEGLDSGGWTYRMENGGPKGIFGMAKRLGYQGGGIMSWNGVVSQNAIAGNPCTAEALDVAPKGYWGLATFDPSHYSQDELRKMIADVYADKRFIGMKPYQFYGFEYHDPVYDAWWEYGNQNKFYGLIHNSRADLLEVETLAKRYPDVRWIIAHAGGSFKMADMAIAAIKKYPNVYAEITLTPVPLGVIEYLVAGAGENRMLYGSDLPMRDPRQQLGWLVFSTLPLEVKKKILAENAMQVIKPCLDRLPEHSRPSLASK
ncbi:amidohydrolase family protein [Dyadobacter beijingensis]|uniref:amidohydrolase family protein n=1 Tax=Dyadobacter beijingensis TaxID=365489 RepID=UPI000365BAC8|nr:amidohydrolase family protein [Dyadobacter beijingensis]